MISIKANDIKLSPAAQKVFNESNYPELEKSVKDMFQHFQTVLESDPYLHHLYGLEVNTAWQELMSQFLSKMVVYQRSDDIGKPADVWHAESSQ